MSSKTASDAGAGSVWNANSWHWEEKSYTTWAKDFLNTNLKGLRRDTDAKLRTVVTKVDSVEGTASINIRKGKKMPFVSLDIKLTWEVVNDKNICLGEGSLILPELMADDIRNGEFDSQVRAEKATSHIDGQRCKDVVERNLLPAIKETLNKFMDELVEKDGGEAALAKDKELREAEMKRAEAARAERDSTKDELLQQANLQAEEARRRRIEAESQAQSISQGPVRIDSANAAAVNAPAPQKISSAPQPIDSTPQPVKNSAAKPEGQGSVWNANSYHWEEKTLTDWARGRVRDLLNKFDIDIPGGRLQVVEISEFHGEASVSIRRGKKLLFFEFNVKGTWEGELVDGEGNVLATGDGEFEIPDLDQDTDIDDDLEIRVKASGDGGHSDLELKQQFIKYGIPQVREIFRQFVNELRAK